MAPVTTRITCALLATMEKPLTECFLHPMKVADRELLMPLGDWDKHVSSTWRWFYSTENEMLYK
jgi:hypothetical protein